MRANFLHNGSNLIMIAITAEENGSEKDLHKFVFTNPAITQPNDQISSEKP